MRATGRTSLTKSVLMAQPIYHLTALKIPENTLHEIDKLWWKFLWAGGENISGGKCKVNWERVCRPKDLGSLGILELHKFAKALRVRWLWYEWTAPDKPWIGTPVPCDNQDRDLFAVATTSTIGDRKKASFWHSHLIDGRTPKSLAPLIFQASRRKNRSVREAVDAGVWISVIRTEELSTSEHLRQYVDLWVRLLQPPAFNEHEDTIIWKLTANGVYTTKLAYWLQFIGATRSTFNETIWKCWAPPKCKFFAWLVIQICIWTVDRLQKRGWQNQQLCPLCRVTQESAVHLLTSCRVTCRIWEEIQRWESWDLRMHDWGRLTSGTDWCHFLLSCTPTSTKNLKSMIILMCWEVWCERNARIFRHHASTTAAIVAKIKEEART